MSTVSKPKVEAQATDGLQDVIRAHLKQSLTEIALAKQLEVSQGNSRLEIFKHA